MQTIHIDAPASKSVSHRSMIAAALAPGDSLVSNVLKSRDLEQTSAILRTAGARISEQSPGVFAVSGMSGKPQGSAPGQAPASCDVHESGTTCRLLTAVLSAGNGLFRIHGAPRMHERPLGELIAVLRQQGTIVNCEEKEGYPPLVLEASGFKGGDISIGLDESSQYLSGLLLGAPLAQNAQGMRITVGGRQVVSWPYVGLTLEVMDAHRIPFVVEVRATQDSPWQSVDWRSLNEVKPGCLRIYVPNAFYKAGKYSVEGDWSNASYFLAAGALGANPVSIKGLNPLSVQGDRAMLQIMERMGARIELHKEDGVDCVTVYPSTLRGIDVDMGYCPDLVPTVAVLAAYAEGVTRINNVAHLKIKECDRIAVPAQHLRAAGVKVDEKEDGMWVYGGLQRPHNQESAPARPLSIATHQDHRIAMSSALFEFAGFQPEYDDPACVTKSFPTFWDVWAKIQASIRKNA